MSKSTSLSPARALKWARSGHLVWSVWGHVHTSRFVTHCTHRLEVYARSQVLKGKRKHQKLGNNFGEFGHLLNGSWGPYFRKQKHAEAFAQQIRDGQHPRLVETIQEHGFALDEIDELEGLCDRGIGIFEGALEERERQHEESLEDVNPYLQKEF